ncbi:uncharacterized protein LOC126215215 isoform X1 [Schistocerca nitens]|uniref:uncharacterized protein LOC126215215 isoform X1 n=1 Tax=Schistocerca nitens TaxID=7011 RepID=UPI0021188D1E|nr:uncharacterized protein LOC126215215 isoform X1 [Schistocerca nitens]
MPGSKKLRPDRLDSTDMGEKESHKKGRTRRTIDILMKELDRSEVPRELGEPDRKCITDSWQEDFWRKCNSDSEKRIRSGNVKNLTNRPSTSARLPVDAQIGKGREHLLMKAAASLKLSNLFYSANHYTLPSLQPVVMVDKLHDESTELPAHRAVNGTTVATSKPGERRKFFVTEPKWPTRSSGLNGRVNGVCNGRYLPSSPRTKFGRKKDSTLQGKRNGSHALNGNPLTTSTPAERRNFFVADRNGHTIQYEETKGAALQEKGSGSEETVLGESRLSSSGRRGSKQVADCSAELDEKRAELSTPIQVNGVHEGSSIWKETLPSRKTGPGGCAKRKTSPTKDNSIVKVRRADERSEEYERGTRSCVRGLFEDQSEECEKILADVNELQRSQNGAIVNQSGPTREAVQCEQESSVYSNRKCVTSALEVGVSGHLSGNVANGDCDSSTADCNTVESTGELNVPGCENKTSSDDCQSSSYAVSSSLQPVVVLRKLTCDEIRHYTSERLTPREETSQKCVEQCGSIDNLEISSEPSLLSFENRMFSGGCTKGYRKSYGKKSKFFKGDAASLGDQGNGKSCEQESPESETEERLCRAIWPKPATELRLPDVERNSVANSLPNYSCNGVRENPLDKIVGCADAENFVSKRGNDKVSPNSGFSNGEVVGPDISSAEAVPPFKMSASDNRKCCRNEMCRVATPELIGLENPMTSNRCWMNVTLQTLFSMENFMQSMIKAFENVNVENNSLISCILTVHYARSLGHQECVYEQARKLAEVLGTLNSDYNVNDQQDPSEFILWLFNAFEPALEKYGPSWASGLITENFRFEMEERTCCMGCLNYDVKISSFLILMLDISVGTSKIRSIIEALDAYASTKTIKRTCSHCGEDKSLVKTAFKSVPRYLIINLKRYSVKDGEVIRDETPVRHTSTLSLGKYSVPNSVISKSAVPNSETNCSKAARSAAVASPPKLNISRKSLRRGVGDYNLISIIHHSGFSVSSGHYVCDVYHRTTGKWYSYNDKMVKEIYETTLFSAKRQKTGYIYVYQNKNC